MGFVTINNTIFDKSKVTSVVQDEKNNQRVTLTFDNGSVLIFEGAEAAQVWKEFDNGGWRDDN